MRGHMGRREALKWGLLGTAGALGAADSKWPAKAERHPYQELKVGLTSYSTRELPLDTTVKILKKMGIGYISIKDVHLPLGSTREERRQAKKKVEDAGLSILGCGVITLRNDEAEIRRALDYVKEMGAPTAVVAPDPPALPLLNKVVKDYDLRVAIHNHGPEDKKFPSPLGVFEAVQGLDKKIGCCVDVGHTFRLGLDPAAALRKCASRLYDVHLKDVAANPSGPDLRPRNVPLGMGSLDVVAALRALVEMRYAYHVALEFEADPENPIAGMALSFGFIRGVLAT